MTEARRRQPKRNVPVGNMLQAYRYAKKAVPQGDHAHFLNYACELVVKNGYAEPTEADVNAMYRYIELGLHVHGDLFKGIDDAED